MIRVLVVDDHAVVRSGLRLLLERESDIECAGEAGTAADAVREARFLEPDVIVLDVTMPDRSGIDVLPAIRSAAPGAKVLMLSMQDDPTYVREAFGSDRWSAAVGFLTIGIAVVAAAAIGVGSAGYIAVFVALPQPVILAAVAIGTGAIAAWGIKESVAFAGALTLIEVGGLVVLVAAGAFSGPDLVARLPEAVPPGVGLAGLLGLAGATLLAVFAFIGFEALVNVSEELHDPQRTLPWAIFLTLALTTLLYVLVVWVALVAVPAGELAASNAPLALAFERLTGASPRVMSAVAIVATLNGIVVQIVLASRVLYGLARQGALPPVFQQVSPLTQTPLVATAVAVALILALALLLPLEGLADLSARFSLVLFAIVNLALIRIKAREEAPPRRIYLAPRWVPWAGLASCLVLLLVDLGMTVAAGIGSLGG